MSRTPFSHPSVWHPTGATITIGTVQVAPELVTGLVIYVAQEGPVWRRFATVQIDASSRAMPIWDNRDRLVVTMNGDSIFGGFISESGFDETHNQWVLVIADGFERMKRTKLKALTCAGLSSHEMTHFLVRRSGWVDKDISGLPTNSNLRPFWFSIPLRNVAWPRSDSSPTACLFGDMILQCHDDISQGLFAQVRSPDGLLLVDEHPEWDKSVPKLSGAVIAANFYDAWHASLTRARVGLDFLLAASRFTASAYKRGDDIVQIGWAPDVHSARPRLSTAIFLRDVSRQQGKPLPRFMVFDSDAADGDFQLDLNQAGSHIGALWQVLQDVVQYGRHVRAKDGTLEKGANQRLAAYQRSLRWLSDGRMQELPEDALLSYWFGLEALLASRPYKNLFEGGECDGSRSTRKAT